MIEWGIKDRRVQVEIIRRAGAIEIIPDDNTRVVKVRVAERLSIMIHDFTAVQVESLAIKYKL